MRIKELYSNVVSKILERPKEPEFTSGLPSLDNLLWGFKRGETAVIASRTSQGKTSFSLFLAYNLALQKKKVAFFTLEMSKESLAERFLAMVNRIDNEKILKNQLDEIDIENIKAKIFSFLDLEFYIKDDIGFSWRQVEEYIKKEKPDIVFVDYVQMINSTNQVNERLAYSEFVRQSKILAKVYNIPIILNSQVNRQAVEEKTSPDIPRLQNLKGTGVLEENVDVVLILHWAWKYARKVSEEDKYPKEEYTIWVAKNRNGRTGMVNICFIPEYYWFYE
jgi:replicative DNA helicase